MTNKNFYCMTNVKIWREMPHVGLEVIALVQLAFYLNKDDSLAYEITDVCDFEKFNYGGKEVSDWETRKKIMAFLKETLTIDVYREIEQDTEDIINDIGIVEYFFEQTGLKYPTPAKPKKCKTCGK